MNEKETENLSLILEMLLSIEARINALINFSIDKEDIELFNDEIQRQRKIIVRDLSKGHRIDEISLWKNSNLTTK
ncbi:hypothetical protein [uncultured Draconibacterium sp.]|uniref:hypothetical protein n=1 Tax=uncultured Draconibacterium sp. TaxID=1573823 RepID=UPI0025DDA162|nr:hypothetical protein [uncultured Draconibacterium sp.]